MVLVLNKADKGGASDDNISKIFSMHDDELCFVSSALTECFLKKACDDRIIQYKPGGRTFKMLKDNASKFKDILVAPSTKVDSQLDKIADYMFRFGGTGVWDAIHKCVELCEPVVVYPVQSFGSFVDSHEKCLGTAIVAKRGTSLRAFSYLLHEEIGRHYLYAENETRKRLGEHDPVTDGLVVKFFTSNTTVTETIATVKS